MKTFLFIACMATFFLTNLYAMSLTVAFVTSQAASDRQQNVWWRGLLQVSPRHEQQTRPLIHSRDSS